MIIEHPARRTLSSSNRRVSLFRVFLLSIALAAALFAPARSAEAQLSTEDHIAEPGFWPTKGQDSMAQFAASGSCARCHAAISHSAMASSMGRTAMRPDAAETLAKDAHLSFLYAPDLFRIDTDSKSGKRVSIYSVTDGKEKVSWPLAWVFGTNRVGQSYLFRKADGGYYEARVTLFRSLNNIAFTPARDFNPTDRPFDGLRKTN